MGLTVPDAPIALDEYPIHQAPLPMSRVASSDRNFYDRCYFNAHDRTGDIFLVTGLGVYPNLGVIDAYAAARTGDLVYSVRFSDALAQRSTEQRVGGYRIEVTEPLRRLHLTCASPDRSLDFDLHWTGSFPAVQEEPHLLLSGDRPIVDSSRFCQLGSWRGQLRVGGREFEIDDETWSGARDRSWGIRPVGEGEAAGRPADEARAGFWWLYLPLRFRSCALIVILQENPDGYRTLSNAKAGLPRRAGRAAGLAASRDPLPAGHQAAGVGAGAPDRPGGPPGRGRVGDVRAREHRPPRPERLRRLIFGRARLALAA